MVENLYEHLLYERPSAVLISNWFQSEKDLLFALVAYLANLEPTPADCLRLVTLSACTRILAINIKTRLRTSNGAKLRFKGVRFKNMNCTTYMMNL